MAGEQRNDVDQSRRTIVEASLYMHELFRHTIHENTPPNVATKTQMDIFVTLRMAGPLSMSALSERVGIAPEQATRTVKQLRDLGFVESERSTENRRMVIARLTEKGFQLMSEHEHRLDRSIKEILEGLNDSEMEQFVEASRTICELMQKIRLRNSVVRAE